MGVKNAHHLTHQITGVTQQELLKIVEARSHRRDGQDKPTIDIDVSYVYRKLFYKDNHSRINYIMSICDVLCKSGSRVVLVCDGSVRHHSKRASVQRQVERYKTKVQLYQTRCELMQVIKSISLATTETEKENLKKAESRLADNSSKLEKKIDNADLDVGDILFNKLIEESQKKMEKDPKVEIIVMQAEFQADSVIAYRTMENLNDMTIMEDSDLAALCGKQCVSISKFEVSNLGKRNSQLTGMELFFADVITRNAICNIIGLDVTSERASTSLYPFFDGVDDYYIRGLIAVGIGCDVYVGGVPGITLVKFSKVLVQIKEECTGNYEKFKEALLDLYVKEHKIAEGNNLTDEEIRKMILIFTDTFVYEPGNFRYNTTMEPNSKNLYIHKHTPDKLHKYCYSFARNNLKIKMDDFQNENCLTTCPGPGTGEHPFLTLEGTVTCAACYSKCCKHCAFKHKIHQDMNDEGLDVDEYVEYNFCVNCYVSELSVNRRIVENSLSKTAMIKKLSNDANCELQQTDSLADVMDIYDCLINNPGNQIYNNTQTQTIKFPCQDANFLKQQTVIAPFDFKDGGQFITDDRISMQQRVQVLDLMSALINFDDLPIQNEKKSTTERIDYSVIPTLLIYFAEGSRLHTGFRLVKRTIRHAMDPTAPPILNARGYLSMYENEVAMTIIHHVKASMKSDVYAVQVSCTKTQLVGCTCTCKAGASGAERVVCVHILPVLYSVTQLLFDGLAGHFLGQFRSVFNEEDEKKLSREEIDNLKLIISNLKNATNNYTLDTDSIKKKKIVELLDDFTVGTEKPKYRPGLPKNIASLGPIRNIKVQSTVAKAMSLIPQSAEPKAQLRTKNKRKSVTPKKNVSTSNKGICTPNKGTCTPTTNKRKSTPTKLHDVPNPNPAPEANLDPTTNNANAVPVVPEKIEINTRWQREDYVRTKAAINAFCTLTSTPNTQLFRSLIGYQIINQRIKTEEGAFPEDPELAEEDQNLIDCAIMLANQEFRRNKWRNEFEVLLGLPKTRGKRKKEEAPTSNPNKKPKKSQSKDKIADYVNSITNPTPKRRVCAACQRSIRKFPETKFMEIPRGNRGKSFENIKTDYLRKNYFRAKHRRQLFLKKLSLEDKQGLFLCDRHPFIDYTCNIPWIDINGEEQVMTEIVAAPINQFPREVVSARKRLQLLKNTTNTPNKNKSVEISCYVVSKPNSLNGLSGDNIIDSPPKAVTRGQIKKGDVDNTQSVQKHRVITKKEQLQVIAKSKTKPRRCDFVNCDRLSNPKKGIVLQKLPIKVPKLHHKTHRLNRYREQYAVQMARRNICLDRIGSTPLDDRNDIRICNFHLCEEYSLSVPWINNKEEPQTAHVIMDLPLAIGEKSTINPNNILKPSGGVGNFRAATKNTREAIAKANTGESISSLSLALGNSYDELEKEKELRINNIPVEKKLPRNVNKFRIKKNQKIIEEQQVNEQIKSPNKPAKIPYQREKIMRHFNKTTNDYIKESTGFKSLLHMLSYICVLCKGDLQIMFKTSSNLTWFEEWLLYFQIIWGKPLGRWVDAKNEHAKSMRRCRYVFDLKLREISLKTRNDWPPYVTHTEDVALRKEKWNAVYGDDKRIIMWDNTAIRMKGKPTDAEFQRNTYSSYYAGNVAKGAVFIQLCGWIGAHDLWVGAVSDSEYMKRSGILTQQQEYIEKDDQQCKEINWVNILDKGYKVGAAAWQAGGQLVLQPSFAKAEQKFSAHDTIRSAGIAADRSANERAVNRCKGCGYLDIGIKSHTDLERISDVWLAWSFQVNFMYKPVL